MPQERIAMRRIRDLLRYYYGEGHSQRLTPRYVELSRAAVQNYLARAKAAGLTWPLPDGLTDGELEVLLFPEPVSMAGCPQPYWTDVENQLAEKHMTLERVWNAYHKAHPGGYSYGHFCALYKNGKGARKVVMRLTQATSSLCTLPARPWRCSRVSTAKLRRRRSSEPPRDAPITPMCKRPPIRRYAVGSVPMCGPYLSSAQCSRWWSAIT